MKGTLQLKHQTGIILYEEADELVLDMLLGTSWEAGNCLGCHFRGDGSQLRQLLEGALVQLAFQAWECSGLKGHCMKDKQVEAVLRDREELLQSHRRTPPVAW